LANGLAQAADAIIGGGRGGEGSDKEFLSTIKQLKDQLAQSRVENSELKEDFAGREAELESKVQRLTESLKSAKEAPTSVKLDVEASQEAQPAGQPNAELDALKHELFLAVEAKRIASNRLEDMRQELEATQRRCDQTTAELKLLRTKYDSMEGQLSKGSGAAEAEVKDLKGKLRQAEEERNVLQHTLEWKEVQWQSKMEHLEFEHAELKRRQEAEVANLKKQLDDTVADYKRKLEDAEREKAVLACSANSGGGQAAGGGGLLAFLRCPSRAEAASPSTTTGSNDPMHCREVGWRLLKLVPTGMALLCEVPGLRVLDVTEQAKVTWGEGLAGSLVVSLLASPTSAAWLRRAIVTHQNLASLEGSPGDVPGFAVHQLGRLEFRDGGGQTFDSSVTVVHLPSEPKLGKAPTVVVIMEPALAPKPTRRAGGSRRSAIGGGTRAGSAVMSAVGGASVVSDDVLPSDSASNIAARYM